MTIVSKMERERGRRADDRERDEPNERAESERASERASGEKPCCKMPAHTKEQVLAV